MWFSVFLLFPVHFWTYEQQFLLQYCQLWVKMELDTHLAQQALREALDTKEVQEARERLNHISDLSRVSTGIKLRHITDGIFGLNQWNV